MKKRILAAIVCAVTAISLTGCGKEETSAPANTNNSTVSTGTSNPTSTSTTSQTESSAPPAQPALNEADFVCTNATVNGVEGVAITAYKGSDDKVVIPAEIDGKKVVKIGEDYYFDGNVTSPFQNNIDIVSVTIPAEVEYIAMRAFDSCLNLEEVIFLGSNTDFTPYAFENTPWLEKKVAEGTQNGLTVIDNALVSADPETVEGDVVIPDGVTRICSLAFSNHDPENGTNNPCDKITSVTISDSVTYIGRSAFSFCSGLESIKLPAGITEINAYTFHACKSLKSIDVPNGVNAISNNAFRCNYGTFKADINLPDTVTTIFYDNDAQNYISYNGTITFKGKTYYKSEVNELIAAIEQNAFEREFGDNDFAITDNVLVKVSPTATKIELPDSVTGIADDAFDGCSQSIVITFKGKNYNLANLDKLKEAVSGN